ncbi:site-specific integrase [soil metagenome]
MATITNRGPYQYQALVRRKGYPAQTRTFETIKAAKDWAKDVEAKMRRGEFTDRSEAERTTLGELLERYRQDVTPSKRGHCAENYRLLTLLRHPLALRPLASLRSADFSKYRDERLKLVAPKTVQHDLSLFSAVLNTARLDWSIPVDNAIKGIRKPKLPQGRERRLSLDEENRLLTAAEDCRATGLRFCIVLALETGMRRGEIANLTWEQIDLTDHIIRLKLTKNGDGRDVPLTAAAEAAILRVPRPPQGGRLTTFFNSNGIGAAFRRTCKRANIDNFCFHDLRHEAASRRAKTVPAATLAKIFGWKTLQMVMRHYNPTASELVAAVRLTDDGIGRIQGERVNEQGPANIAVEIPIILQRESMRGARVANALTGHSNVIQGQFGVRSAS